MRITKSPYSALMTIMLLSSANVFSGTATHSKTAYTYYSNGKLESINGPRLDVLDITTLTYHEDTGFLHTTTSPLGFVTTYESYNDKGKLTKLIDPDGLTTQIDYNNTGQVISSRVHTGDELLTRTTLYEYTSLGELSAVILPSGDSLTYEYDSARRLEAIQNLKGDRVEYILDDAGNILTESTLDSAGIIVMSLTKTYDELSRVKDIFGQHGQHQQLGYDPDGNLVSSTDSLNTLTEFSYDNLGRLKKTIEENTAATDYIYDSSESISKVIDARGLETTYLTNGLTHTTSLNSPDTGITHYEYDSAGNMTSKVIADGTESIYTYDEENTLTAVLYPNFPTENITYSYYLANELGGKYNRIKNISKNGSVESFQYTKFGELEKHTTQIDGLTSVTTYEYSEAGNLIREGRSGFGYLIYDRDLYGNLAGIRYAADSGGTPDNIVSQIGYQAFGTMSHFTHGNGLVTNIDYDLDGAASNIDVGLPSSTVLSLNYVINNRGTINSIVDLLDSPNTQVFGYDSSHHLTSASGEYGNISYAYDLVGNRTDKTDNNSVFSYTYALDSNQLETITGPTETDTLQYASTGQLTEQGNSQESPQQYTYDASGRLIGYVNVGATMAASYAYNGLGQRVKKVVNGSASYYLYSNSGLLSREFDSNGSLLRDYIYLNGQLIGLINHSGDDAYTISYVHNNHLNTPIKVTDETGNIAWSANYKPFGQVDLEVENIVLNVRFPGQYYDYEKTSYYNYFRDYDPEIGRYIQSDPIGLSGGINTYGYVQGNPVSYFDPYGLSKMGGDGSATGRGTGNQYKHCKPHPTDLNKIVCKDKRTGKKKVIPKPHDFPQKKEMCGDTCQAGLVVVGGACVIAACALNPLLCGLAVTGVTAGSM